MAGYFFNREYALSTPVPRERLRHKSLVWPQGSLDQDQAGTCNEAMGQGDAAACDGLVISEHGSMELFWRRGR